MPTPPVAYIATVLASQELELAWKVTFRAVKLAANTVKVALFMVEPVLLAVSLYEIIVLFLPAP